MKQHGYDQNDWDCWKVLTDKPWRMLAPVEGLTGILMSGLSAGLFFAVVSRIFASRLQEQSR